MTSSTAGRKLRLGTVNYLELKEVLDTYGRRFNHSNLDKTCSGSSNSMIIGETDDGISAYCFRCGVRYMATRPSSAAARYQRQKVVCVKKLTEGYRREYPEGEADFLLWPREARDWALQYVDVRTLRDSMARWDWHMHRLWFPVSLGSAPVRWSGRNFGDPDRPKYLSGRVPDYSYHDPFGSGEVTVVTECVLGALRIAQDTQCRAYPLLGTGLGKVAAYKLSQRASRVVVWLDNDNTQVLRARRKLTRQLQSLGLEVSVYRGPHDPKRDPDPAGELASLLEAD